ncbi:MAG TPA: 2-amino-4-hydroxy-6-hydroxymethyldihydropteridine diphosphokinase [Candidatus Paceibacterota bacterium]
METIFLGLGSNMGDRAENIRKALKLLREKATLVAVSHLYESEPHGVEEPQPLYYNLALRATTELQPLELLAFVKDIERILGREDGTHNKPRPIDIDILLYGKGVHESSELTIPHPRMHERAFVLVPLSQIAPLTPHPTLKVVIAELEFMLGDYSDLAWLAEERL